MRYSIAVVLSTVCCLLSARVADAATHTWTGLGDALHWSDGNNWTNGVPTSNEVGGTIIEFGTGTSTVDDIVGLTVNLLHFVGNNNLVGGTTLLQFTSLASIVSDTGTNMIQSSLPIAAGSQTLGLYGKGGGVLVVDSVISGSGEVGVYDGTVRLSGVNTMTNTTFVNDGTLLLAAPGVSVPHGLRIGDGAGSFETAIVQTLFGNQWPSSADVTIFADGKLDLNSIPASVGDVFLTGGRIEATATTLTLTGNLNATGGPITNGASAANIFGTLNLGSTVHTFTITNFPPIDPDLIIHDSIVGSGAAGIIKTGDGAVTIEGSSPNTYPGTTTVQQGALRMGKPNGIDAIVGPIVVSGGKLEWAGQEQIKDTVQLTILAGGSASIVNVTETIGSLVMHSGGVSDSQITRCCSNFGKITVKGNITSVSDGVGSGISYVKGLDLDASAHVLNVADGPGTPDMVLEVATGSGGFTKTGAGSVKLVGDNTFTGTATLAAGDFSIGSGAGDHSKATVVLQGGTFSGFGNVAALSGANGALRPGASPGVIVVNGAMSLGSQATFNVEINGTNAAQYDHMLVDGPVSLSNATLNISLGFAPALNTKFTIISNGNGPTTGTFNGLADGSTFGVGGAVFRINYNAGDGNDVVLTVLATVPTMSQWLTMLLGLMMAAMAARRLAKGARGGAILLGGVADGHPAALDA